MAVNNQELIKNAGEVRQLYSDKFKDNGQILGGTKRSVSCYGLNRQVQPGHHDQNEHWSRTPVEIGQTTD